MNKFKLSKIFLLISISGCSIAANAQNVVQNPMLQNMQPVQQQNQSAMPQVGVNNNPQQPQIQQPQQVQNNNGQQVIQVPMKLPPMPTANDALQQSGVFLNAQEILKVRQLLGENAQATAKDVSGKPVKGVSRTVTTNLKAEEASIALRIAGSYPASLVFTDSNGNPWPIANFVGGSTNVQLARPIPRDTAGTSKESSSSLVVAPSTQITTYSNGGINVYLEGLETPVTLTYIGGQEEVDQRLEIKVMRVGPKSNAHATIIKNPSANPKLTTLLDGIAPEGAMKVGIISDGINGTSDTFKVWNYNGKLYILSDYAIVSPGALNGMRSASGRYAYEFDNYPVFMLSIGSKIVSINLDL